MGFPESVRNNVLIKCKRHCCLCGNYAGIYMELHHIRQKADRGEDTEENCIPLCFNCHADVKSYNPHHPKGLKYTEKELIARRDQVYESVKNLAVISPYFEEDILIAKRLLDNYHKLLEDIISLDPCAVGIELQDIISAKCMADTLQNYEYVFSNVELDREKCCLINAIIEWYGILFNDRYFHTIDGGRLCFNNTTVNEYRETMLNIRTQIRNSYWNFRTVATQRV